MKPWIASLGLLAAISAAPVLAVSGGKLGTLDRGTYICETPGDAEIGRGIVIPDAGFEVTRSSSYIAADGGGHYLRLGDKVTFTSGPRKGDRYVLKSDSFLRKVDDKGEETGLRCVRRGVDRF